MKPALLHTSSLLPPLAPASHIRARARSLSSLTERERERGRERESWTWSVLLRATATSASSRNLRACPEETHHQHTHTLTVSMSLTALCRVRQDTLTALCRMRQGVELVIRCYTRDTGGMVLASPVSSLHHGYASDARMLRAAGVYEGCSCECCRRLVGGL